MPKQQPQLPPPPEPTPLVSNKTVAAAVYVLYFLAYFTGVTAIAGAIMAHLQVDSAEPVLKSHFRFQIRTFWIGLLYIFGGVLLAVKGIGILLLMWWVVWSLVRNIKGFLTLNENKPIADPESWMFG